MAAAHAQDVVAADGRLAVHVRSSGPGGTVPAVTLSGELDMAAVTQVDMYLRRRLGPFFFRKTLLFDLAGATLIDSSFVGYLVGLAMKARQSGHDMVISRPVPKLTGSGSL